MWAFLMGGFLTDFLCASRLASFLRERDGWAQWHVKIHRRGLARIVYSKQCNSSSNLKAFFWRKKCFERIPSRPEFACKFADWFPSVFQSLQMLCRVFCNLADSSSASKQIRKLWCSRPKKKKTTHVTIQVQAFRRKPRKLRLFSRNKKPWGLNKGKRKSNAAAVIKSCQKTFAET